MSPEIVALEAEIERLRDQIEALKVWHCVIDHRTRPCGDCVGCRAMYAAWFTA